MNNLDHSAGCPRRPINPIIWLVVLYSPYIWMEKKFVLYFFYTSTSSRHVNVFHDVLEWMFLPQGPPSPGPKTFSVTLSFNDFHVNNLDHSHLFAGHFENSLDVSSTSAVWQILSDHWVKLSSTFSYRIRRCSDVSRRDGLTEERKHGVRISLPFRRSQSVSYNSRQKRCSPIQIPKLNISWFVVILLYS